MSSLKNSVEKCSKRCINEFIITLIIIIIAYTQNNLFSHNIGNALNPLFTSFIVATVFPFGV